MPRSAVAARNVARVEEIYAAYRGGDIDAVLNALTPDALWVSVADGTLPWAGTHRGPDGVRAYFATVAQALQVTGYELEQVIAEDDTVIVLADIRLACRATGCDRPFRKVDVLRLKDGMIAEFREYYDTLGVGRLRDGG